MIIRLEFQILIAVILDMALGDPWGFPHPVRGIGWAVEKVEYLTRKIFRSPRKAGILTWFMITAGTGASALFVIRELYMLHPLAGDCVSILFLYTTVACRDLIRHALYIEKGVQNQPIEEARRRLSMIVSRQTDTLSKEKIVTTTVESVAENISDGVVAPLFFAFLGGPVLAMMYKAVSTLDSMVGYKNTRYTYFGWFSARADDVFNFFPARISAFFLWVSTLVLGLNRKEAWAVMKRDSRKHSSPNAGWPESVVAGALGLRFGGAVWYFGTCTRKPFIGGDVTNAPGPEKIVHVIRMLGVTLIMSLLVGGGLRFGCSLLFRN